MWSTPQQPSGAQLVAPAHAAPRIPCTADLPEDGRWYEVEAAASLPTTPSGDWSTLPHLSSGKKYYGTVMKPKAEMLERILNIYGIQYASCQVCGESCGYWPEDVPGPRHYGKLCERLGRADVNTARDAFWQEWMLPSQAGYVRFNHLDGSVQMLKGNLPRDPPRSGVLQRAPPRVADSFALATPPPPATAGPQANPSPEACSSVAQPCQNYSASIAQPCSAHPASAPQACPAAAQPCQKHSASIAQPCAAHAASAPQACPSYSCPALPTVAPQAYPRGCNVDPAQNSVPNKTSHVQQQVAIENGTTAWEDLAKLMWQHRVSEVACQLEGALQTVHASEGSRMCQLCAWSPWSSLGTLDEHLRSESHIQNMALTMKILRSKNAALENMGGEGGPRVQCFQGDQGKAWFNHLTGESGVVRHW